MSETAAGPLRFDEFELDEENALLTRGGRPIALPPKAFAVLCTLARQPGKLTKKEDLLDAVWGHRHVSESVLKTTISQVRTALADPVAKPRYIETASRRGYRFIGVMLGAPVPAPAAPPAPSVEVKPVATGTRPPMIGRTAPLTKLHAAWRKVVDGNRCVFWIAGDAGVGKTTLVEQFIGELPGALVIRGQCVEQYGAGEPYLPILEALNALCRSNAGFPALMRSVAPTWLAQLPWLMSETERATLYRDLSGANQERKVREVSELLGRFTMQHPVLFLTEDLHWSDNATLRLLDHFARRTSPARLMWLGTYRLMQVIAESHPLKDLRQELRLHRLCEEVVLDPFSEVEVGEYLESRLPEAGIQEAFIHKLHDHTGGLPLFIANVVDDLAAQGASGIGGATTRAATPAAWSVPESLAGAIEKHIAKLAPEAQRLLEAASFCGVEFRASTVAEVLGQDLATITQRCDELAQRQYWLQHVAIVDLPDGTLDARYAFRHALYRHVFYQRQGASTRVQMHRRVAAALERGRAAGITVTAAELASQYEAGLVHTAALRYYAEAARNAVGHFAPQEAIDITLHALSLLPRCPEGTERLELEFALAAVRGLACSQQFGLASPEGEIAYHRALLLCDILPLTPARAQVLGGLAWMYYIRAEYDDALSLSQRLEALALTHDDALLLVASCCLLGVIHTMRGKYAEARHHLERGLEECAKLGDNVPHTAFVADPVVVLRVNLAIPLMHLGYVDQARAQMDIALMRGRQRGELMARTIALWCAAMFEMRMQRPDRVADHAQALCKLVEDHAIGQAQGPSRWIRGWAEAYLGSPQEGLRLILEGFEFNQRLGMVSGGSEVLGYAVEALLLAGDWAGAQAQLDKARALGRRFGERILFMYHHLLQARIHMGLGDFAAARVALEDGVAEARSQGSLWMEVRLLVHVCGLPDAGKQDRAQLKAVYDRLPEGFSTAMISRARELLQSQS
ncbi:MAG TPA: AAA family ATPase [Steroidobacteraceae bacterium]|nr:AAA family ATPase [Steroidobacteraceae bacterium]